MIKNKLIGILTSAAMLFSAAGTMTASADSGTMRDITTMELVRGMGIGINLGNTYESCGDWIAQWGDGSVESYETAWGSPVVTQELIQGYADEGFGVLRVPVAWSNLMGSDYTISSSYLAKVTQVIDWAIDADMYVIVNLHWDGGWFENFPTDKENCMYKYTRIWTQLCDAFENYSDYLMFESQNEELGWESVWNKWQGNNGKETAYQLVNEINQKFVDIVRSSGGNNSQRHLLISGYNTGIDVTCDPLFKMPDDPVGRCAVSVHYYTPADFAILEEDASWAKARSTWGTDADFAELNQQMDMMKTTFVDKGIPVIIGEYGCPKKNKDPESVKLFITSVCEAIYSRQMCPVLWDITDLHYDRSTYKMIDSSIKESFWKIGGIEEKQPLIGDANNNGEVEVADAVYILQGIADPSNSEYVLTGTAKEQADADGSGAVDAQDALVIQQYKADIIGSLPFSA